MKMPVTVATAKYREATNEDEKSNPLVLALPTRFEPKRVNRILSERVICPDLSNLDESSREKAVGLINKTRIATSEHHELYCKLYNMIHANYLVRNPTKPEVVAWSYDIGDPEISLDDTCLTQEGIDQPNTTSDAIFVSGFSGNGKSTMTERILFKCFPQIIEHDFKRFNEPQIVYLKVDMPSNGSKGGLLEEIMAELDRALSKSSIDIPKYSNSVIKTATGYKNLSSLESQVISALNRHSVGVLIIDEFQNLLVASKNRRREMLQLLDTFANKLFVPTLKIGTPDSRELVSFNSRHLRRLGEPYFINPLKNNERDWELAMKALFAFQPVQKPIERNKEIEGLLKTFSGGVPDYLIKLWKGSLIEAIRSGKERLTQAIIKKVFKQQFPLLRNAIRNINKGEAKGYSDLLTAQQYFDAGNSQNAIKFIEKFANATKLSGVAAQDVLEDIENSVEKETLTTTQLNKIAKIKASLKQKAEESSGPQTIEHKP